MNDPVEVISIKSICARCDNYAKPTEDYCPICAQLAKLEKDNAHLKQHVKKLYKFINRNFVTIDSQQTPTRRSPGSYRNYWEWDSDVSDSDA